MNPEGFSTSENNQILKISYLNQISYVQAKLQ